MYKYSPIKKIYIKNFRNIGEAVIDFEESPIVSLIGENEAGKTSVVKAFSVCALHSTPRDQKDFIRDGTKMFGVAIELEDGTMVKRMKETTVNMYEVVKPDGTRWTTNKIDSGLPLAVQEVMGMIEEPETKEYLQVRTYEDQLLFVVTPASTNYKVMYDALKVDQLTRAIKVGSKEANELKAEINANDNGIYTLTNNLRAIQVHDIEPLINIRTRLTKELAEVEKLEKAASLIENIKLRKAQLGAISQLAESNAAEVSEAEATRINSICRLLENITRLNKSKSSISEAAALEQIDMTEHDKLVSIIGKKNKIEAAKKQLGALEKLRDAEEVNVVELDHLLKAGQLSREVASKKIMASAIDVSEAELIEQVDFDAVGKAQAIIGRIARGNQLKAMRDQCDTYCKQVEDWLKAQGVAVETCTRCGESIVIDIEKIKV